jgi:hypothetical protein
MIQTRLNHQKPHTDVVPISSWPTWISPSNQVSSAQESAAFLGAGEGLAFFVGALSVGEEAHLDAPVLLVF